MDVPSSRFAARTAPNLSDFNEKVDGKRLKCADVGSNCGQGRKRHREEVSVKGRREQ